MDSLSAVELIDELQSRFGRNLAAEELLVSSYQSLVKFLLPSFFPEKKPKTRQVKARKTAALPLTSDSAATSRKAPSDSKGLQVILKLLSDVAGTSIDPIDVTATLSELGLDSLSAIEFKGDIENAFQVGIEDDQIKLESRVKDLLELLGIAHTSKLPSSQSASVTEASKQDINAGHPSSRRGNESTLGDPMAALVQSQASFERAAVEQAFAKYCTHIAPKQSELLLAYLCEAFSVLGSNLATAQKGQELALFSHLPRHEKLMQRLLQILEKHELVIREQSKLIRGVAALPTVAVEALHHEFVSKFPAYAGEAQLMALTGPKLADCLIGRADPLGLMFGDLDAQKTMEDFYTASPMMSTLTEQLVNFLEIILNASNVGSQTAPVRILEVGAGFGGTTKRLAESLASTGVRVQYTFTDVSSSFVKKAKAKFAKYSWIDYQVLDLENNMPAPLEATYDIVIGTNCVHATKDKTKTITRLKEVLKPGGFLVLSEVTQPIDWHDIVFGLLDGWWLASDNSYPLQPPESWIKSFEKAGFSRISYSQGPEPESNLQRLLVASNAKSRVRRHLEEVAPNVKTVVYKEVDGVSVEADIYVPSTSPAQAMPVGKVLSF